MILIPLGIIWTGYTLGWFGYAMIQGQGIGFTDLIIPSRVAKVNDAISQWGKQSPANSAPANPPSGKNPFTGGPGGPLLPPGIGSNKGPA